MNIEQLTLLLVEVQTSGAVSTETLDSSAVFDRLERAVEGRTRVDSTIVNHFASLLNEQRRLEDAIGGKPLLASVLRQMETVKSLRFAARGKLIDGVLSLAASHAQFIAWMYQDGGDSARAVEYYSLTQDLAIEADDADMAATALSMKAHVAWSSGEPLRCQRFGEAAAATPGVSPMVRGMAIQMTARGLAMQGDGHSRRVLDQAATLLGTVTDMPDWMYFYGDIWLTLQAGMIESHLDGWARAVELYRDGLDRLPDHYARDRAWYSSCLALAEAESGDAAAALDVARVALPAAQEVRNRHGIKQIERAATRLSAKGAREGRELQELLRETIPS